MRFGTYSIRNGWNGGLESAVEGVGHVGQYGHRCFPVDEDDGRDIHPGIGQVQVSCDVVVDSTPQKHCTILLGLPQLCCQGDTPVWRECHRVPTVNEGAALVHCRMLPGAGIQGDDLVRGGGNERETEGGRAGFCGRL